MSTVDGSDVSQAFEALGELPPPVQRRLAASARPHALGAGDILFRHDDPADGAFVLVSGAVDVLDRDMTVVARVGPGGIVGERGLLDGGRRNATIRAARDTHLIRLPARALARALDAHPPALRRLAGVVAGRQVTTPSVHQHASIRTIALVPAGVGDSTVLRLAEQLAAALATTGKVEIVDAPSVDRACGPDASESLIGEPLARRAAAWLDRVETANRHVILVGVGNQRWTSRCMRSADRVVAVADGGTPPAAVPEGLGDHRDALVVVARDGRQLMPGAAAAWTSVVPAASIRHVDLSASAEVDALARVITGRAFGVVLGGGGARGFAHLGVLRAFETCGVPIDAIGGTSIGAVIAAIHARGLDHVERERLAVEGLAGTKRLLGWTLPLVSLSSTRKLTAILRSPNHFGDVAIEDLPTPYFAVSASFTTGRAVVHDDGPVWEAVRASISLPGVMPPVCSGGDLLVDGGVVNNLPVDVMRDRMQGTVIGVNLRGRGPSSSTAAFPADISGWQVLGRRLHPRRESVRVPGPAAMLLRAKELGGKQAHADRLAQADLVLEPPVSGVDTLDFAAGVPLVEPAYRHACGVLEQWLAQESKREASNV